MQYKTSPIIFLVQNPVSVGHRFAPPLSPLQTYQAFKCAYCHSVA